ncbi:MAG: DUF3052 domain-containing protein [Candidatus Solibacter sp.]
MHYQSRSVAGKLFFEGDHILFRGDERLKVWVKDLKSVTARDGLLVLDFAGGPASFELGAAAEKWAHKILNPPTRAGKLGIKAGLAVRVVGEFPDDFLKELRGLDAAAGRSKADLVFFAATDRRALAQTPKLAAMLKPVGALWIVYPKGVQAIREIEVLGAGRAAGLKDTKVASFSATHTALRFVWGRL